MLQIQVRNVYHLSTAAILKDAKGSNIAFANTLSTRYLLEVAYSPLRSYNEVTNKGHLGLRLHTRDFPNGNPELSVLPALRHFQSQGYERDTFRITIAHERSLG